MMHMPVHMPKKYCKINSSLRTDRKTCKLLLEPFVSTLNNNNNCKTFTFKGNFERTVASFLFCLHVSQ